MYINELGEVFYGIFEKDKEGNSGRNAVAHYFNHKSINANIRLLFCVAKYDLYMDRYDGRCVPTYWGSHIILFYDIYRCVLYVSDDEYNESIEDWNIPEANVREVELDNTKDIQFLPDFDDYIMLDFDDILVNAKLGIFRKKELKCSRFWFMEGC